MANSLWVYLAASPLLWLTGTLVVWLTANRLSASLGNNPLCNPVLVSVLVVVAVLELFHIDYGAYFAGAQFIHFLLGPATVALGIPLYEQFERVKENALPTLVALLVGSLTAVAGAIMLGRLFQFPPSVVVSLAPKSTTAAVAMAISSGLGGDPALTAALVILTGICGAIVVTPLMNLMKIRDYGARGFAVGLASHGIGTARAYAVDPVAGLFAGLAMALNAIVTAVVAHVFL